jgi:N-acetylglutamate synthase-like GNAT family acetyltransferase
MGIKIRKAKSEDSAFLAKMILQSSRANKSVGLFDLIFEGYGEEEILNKIEKLTLADSRSHCRFDNFLVAEVDGVLVGSLCSYEPRISTQETFVEALKEIGCDDSVIDKLNVVHECNFDLNTSTLMFDFLEELDGYIDIGVMKALMQKSLLNARLKGYRIAQAIVEIGSLETLLFYKKFGFKEVDEKECDLYKEKFGRVGVILLSLEF